MAAFVSLLTSSRIYEETLNCLLYENRNGPDQELMQATSTRQVEQTT